MYTTVKPFIKWAGGKSQLLEEIRKKYPAKIERYCEPFVGGGAVLLDVLANFQPKEVLINDINPELTNTYIQIRDNAESVIAMLTEMQEAFWKMDNDERKIHYYSKRDRFNELIKTSETSVEKAALFIFINKTCFNGLYRVNGKGLYNVPIGSYKKPPICDAKNIRLISRLLQNVEVQCGDYSKCADYIDNNTFVYIDPPYRPLSETSSFTSYAKTEFGDEQQIQLGHFIEQISEKGAKVVASNSDPHNTDENDDFFDDIYKMFFIDRVAATRMINSKSNGRGAVSELLICNY
jgi:DNA adenine methylase